MKQIAKFLTLALLGGTLLTAPASNAMAGTFLEDVGESTLENLATSGGQAMVDALKSLGKTLGTGQIDLRTKPYNKLLADAKELSKMGDVIGAILDYTTIGIDVFDLAKVGLAGDREAFRGAFDKLLKDSIGMLAGKLGNYLGGLIGTAIFPGAGTIIGAIGGGIAADLLANWLYERFFPKDWVDGIADWLYDLLFEKKGDDPPDGGSGGNQGSPPLEAGGSLGNGSSGSGTGRGNNPEIEDEAPLPPPPPQVDPRRRRGTPVYAAPSSLPSSGNGGGRKLDHNAF